ncbi:MAG: hypothetical protein Q7N50_14585 [Armatimonadota bacterium]|nr:hypothetical protein [Armatimonadota bacterium]
MDMGCARGDSQECDDSLALDPSAQRKTQRWALASGMFCALAPLLRAVFSYLMYVRFAHLLLVEGLVALVFYVGMFVFVRRLRGHRRLMLKLAFIVGIIFCTSFLIEPESILFAYVSRIYYWLDRLNFDAYTASVQETILAVFLLFIYALARGAQREVETRLWIVNLAAFTALAPVLSIVFKAVAFFVLQFAPLWMSAIIDMIPRLAVIFAVTRILMGVWYTDRSTET